MIASYNPPLIVKKLFNDFIWQTSNNKILLTFDDGPTEITTTKILDLLAKNGIKAAFFCVGKNIRMYPELTNQIITEGHLIANHTMEHKLLTKMNNNEALEEIRSFNDLMKAKDTLSGKSGFKLAVDFTEHKEEVANFKNYKYWKHLDSTIKWNNTRLRIRLFYRYFNWVYWRRGYLLTKNY